MARVPQYTQDRLASSLGIMPAVDTSSADLAGIIAQDSSQVAGKFMSLAAEKQRQVNRQKEKINDVENTIRAYRETVDTENQIHQIIDKKKQEFADDPDRALEEINAECEGLVFQKLDYYKNSNTSVAEKLSGILTNSLRGKMSEARTWASGQKLANTKTDIQTTFNSMYTIAASSSDPNRVLELIGTLEKNDDSDMDFNRNVYYAYGNKGVEEIEKAKSNISEAFLLGMLDRGESNQVLQYLDSGTFDKYLTPEVKHKYRGMANTVIKAQEKQERMDNMMAIFDIKTNAVIKASNGTYTISDAVADANKIRNLGGNPTTSLITQGVKGEKIATKKEFQAKKSAAIKDITQTLGSMTKKGKLDPEAELKDIISFQNKVEGYRPYLTDSEYKTYMSKVTEPSVKRIRKMGKNIFGMPQGDLKGNDPYNKSYLAIYNFADKAYAGKDNKDHAISNMVCDFVRYAEQLENRQGKELTQQQAQNLCNKVIQDQRRRTNPQLNNIPQGGKIMQDKNGKRVRMYPNGKYEILK